MKINYLKVMLAFTIAALSFSLGHDYGKRLEPVWVQNVPKSTHVHKNKMCYSWEGDYNTQVVACIKRGN